MSVSINKGLPVQDKWASWKVYPVSHVEYKGIPCLVEDASVEPKVIEGLPTEFFGHELADVDAMNDEELIEFVQTWGVPHNPYFDSWSEFVALRNKKTPLDVVRDVFKGGIRSILYKSSDLESTKKILTTEAYERHFDDRWWGEYGEKLFWANEAEAVAQSKFVQNHRRHGKNEGGIIALEEVRHSVINLQEITRVFSYIDGFDSEEEILAQIAKDYEAGKPTFSGYIETIGGGLDCFEKVCAWGVEAGRYLTGFLEPLTWSLINVYSTETSKCNIGSFFNGADRFGLTEAIAIQFYYELADGNPWQTCGYDNCNKYFKYQRQNTKPVYLTPKKRSGTGFCCKSHSVMENRRLNNAATDVAAEYLSNGMSKAEAAKAMTADFTEAQIARAIEKAYGAE